MSLRTPNRDRRNLTLQAAGADLLQPMLATLGERTAPPTAEMLDAQAKMSRKRFAVTQCTSMLGGILFLLGIGLYCLTKIEGLSEVMLDKCENSTSLTALCRLVQILTKAKSNETVDLSL